MKKTGIIILLIGVAGALFTGYLLLSKEKSIGDDALQGTVIENRELAWLVMAGALAILTGGVIYLKDKQKSKKTSGFNYHRHTME